MFLFDFVGWVIGAIFYILPVVGYVLGGCLWYAWFGIRFRKEMISVNDAGPYVVGQTLGALLWPIALAVGVGFITVRAVVNGLESMMLSYASRKYADHVERSKAKMISDDLERFGGNMDLIVNYDYVRHDLCFGQGCTHCNEQGVIRRRANRVVEEHEVINDSTNFKLAQKRQEYDREVAMQHEAKMQAYYIAETGRNT